MALIFYILFVVGLILYLFSNGKAQEVGRMITFAGFLGIMLATAGPALQKLL